MSGGGGVCWYQRLLENLDYWDCLNVVGGNAILYMSEN
jgi:hypothetical protein